MSGYTYNNGFGRLISYNNTSIMRFFLYFFILIYIFVLLICFFQHNCAPITSQTVVVNSAPVIHIVTDNVNFVNRLRRLILYNNNSIMRSFLYFLIYYLYFYIVDLFFNRIMMLQQVSIREKDKIPGSLMNEMDFES